MSRNNWSDDADRQPGDVPAVRKSREHCDDHRQFVAGCYQCILQASGPLKGRYEQMGGDR